MAVLGRRTVDFLTVKRWGMLEAGNEKYAIPEHIKIMLRFYFFDYLCRK
ncbi:hypothetical protein [Desulfosporosinus sp. SB140]